MKGSQLEISQLVTQLYRGQGNAQVHSMLRLPGHTLPHGSKLEYSIESTTRCAQPKASNLMCNHRTSVINLFSAIIMGLIASLATLINLHHRQATNSSFYLSIINWADGLDNLIAHVTFKQWILSVLSCSRCNLYTWRLSHDDINVNALINDPYKCTIIFSCSALELTFTTQTNRSHWKNTHLHKTSWYTNHHYSGQSQRF